MRDLYHDVEKLSWVFSRLQYIEKAKKDLKPKLKYLKKECTQGNMLYKILYIVLHA